MIAAPRGIDITKSVSRGRRARYSTPLLDVMTEADFDRDPLETGAVVSIDWDEAAAHALA